MLFRSLAATVAADGKMSLYIDAKLVAEGNGVSIDSKPARPMYLCNGEGAAEGSAGGLSGLLDQFALYHKALTPAEVQQRFEAPDVKPADAILVCNFDNGDSRDGSANAIHGIGSGVETGKGKVGGALWFKGGAGDAAAKAGGSFVKHTWDRFVPIVARSMALAGNTVLVSGAPDMIDEEYAFERLAANVPRHPRRAQRAKRSPRRPSRSQDVGCEHRNRRAIHRPRTHQPARLGRHHRGAGPRVCEHDGRQVAVFWEVTKPISTCVKSKQEELN